MQGQQHRGNKASLMGDSRLQGISAENRKWPPGSWGTQSRCTHTHGAQLLECSGMHMPKGENLASAVVLRGICGWGRDTFCLKCGKQALPSPALASGFFTTSNTWEACVCVSYSPLIQSCIGSRPTLMTSF